VDGRRDRVVSAAPTRRLRARNFTNDFLHSGRVDDRYYVANPSTGRQVVWDVANQ
jgi:hypothetical protein